MKTVPRTHLVVVWRYDTPDEQAPVRAAADDVGRLVVFSELETAEIFAGRLTEYGLCAKPFPVNSPMIADLLDHNNSHNENDVVVFEAQTLNAHDAVNWAIEQADQLVTRLATNYEAAVDA